MMALTPATDRLAEIKAQLDKRWADQRDAFDISDVRYLVAEVERLRVEVALIDKCAFALRGNYPEVLRDFDSMPAEIERLHSDHNDVIEENLSLRAALNDAHTALANVLKTHRAFTEEHGPLLDYSTSAEMVDFDIALNAARAAVVGETTTEEEQ